MFSTERPQSQVEFSITCKLCARCSLRGLQFICIFECIKFQYLSLVLDNVFTHLKESSNVFHNFIPSGKNEF